MFNFICGETVDITENSVILKNNDIGYELFVSANTLAHCNIGQTVRLFCFLQVRDDGFFLYGFSTADEKNMFMRLTTVSGVGCKVALAILSGMELNRLALAIYNGDTKELTKIKGLGKKTAERLILELREKVVVSGSDTSAAAATGSISKHVGDAISILESLGLNRAEAEKRVEKACEMGATTAEELINTAFRIY